MSYTDNGFHLKSEFTKMCPTQKKTSTPKNINNDITEKCKFSLIKSSSSVFSEQDSNIKKELQSSMLFALFPQLFLHNFIRTAQGIWPLVNRGNLKSAVVLMSHLKAALW